jgi:hypothetical protein
MNRHAASSRMAVSRRASSAAASARTLRAQAGLHVLRYAFADDRLAPPRVRLLPCPQDIVTVIMPPGMEALELLSPGDGVVLQVHADTDIAYEIDRRDALGEAHLSLEPVSSLLRPSLPRQLLLPEMPPPAQPMPAAGGDPARRSASEFILLGHVARRGDIHAEWGQWLGDPTSDNAIEGIELRWPSPPRGLDVAVRLTVNDHGRRKLPEAGLGMFAGTRSRAAPVIGLDIGLEGRRPEGWAIDCQAAFLGQAVMSARGVRVALRGKTGREPLVGLRVRIGSEEALQEGTLKELPAGVAHSGARTGRVRIFRPQA